MYAPSDFTPPSPERPRIPPERLTGLAALLIFLFICLALSINIDSEVFNPQNTLRALTSTAAARTSMPTPIPAISPSPTLRKVDQPARFAPVPSSPSSKVSNALSTSRICDTPESQSCE